MKDTINKTQFVTRFGDIGRGDNFSYEARELLFDWFEELEESMGEDIEFDPIAICCEFAESDLAEINHDHDQSFEDLDDAVDWLNDETLVVGVTNQDTVVYQQF